MKFSVRTATMLSVMFMVACHTTTTSTDETLPEEEPRLRAQLFAYRYTRSGDRLTLAVDTTYCVDTTLVSDTFMVNAGIRVNTDSLVLTFTDTLGLSRAGVQTTWRCVRCDTGTSLLGRWRVISDERSVVWGTPTASEGVTLACDSLMWDSLIAQRGYIIIFTQTWMGGTFEGALGRVMVPWVTAGIPVQCRVSVATSGNIIQITGSLSGEVVTISVDSSLNCRYSSSRSSRIPYTIWRKPQNCDRQIYWFTDFLSDNMPFADEFLTSETITFVVQLGAVEVVRVDDMMVRLTGRVTGEVVTVRCDANGTVTFSSTRSEREEWTTYRRSGLTPTWWDLFVMENIP